MENNQDNMAYYDKKTQRRWEMFDFFMRICFKLVLPIFIVLLVWTHLGWIFGLFTVISICVFYIAISIVKSGSDNTQCKQIEKSE